MNPRTPFTDSNFQGTFSAMVPKHSASRANLLLLLTATSAMIAEAKQMTRVAIRSLPIVSAIVSTLRTGGGLTNHSVGTRKPLPYFILLMALATSLRLPRVTIAVIHTSLTLIGKVSP